MLPRRWTAKAFAALAAALLGVWAGAGTGPVPAPPTGTVAFRRVPVPDDAPAHLASALAQDRDGFLWIGTQGGLVRYDGYAFLTLRSDPADPSTLGGSYVRCLLAARDGRLWAGTFSGGASVREPGTGVFRRYRHDPKDPASLAHDRVEALAEDAAGRVWIGTDAGLDVVEPGGRLSHVLRPGPGVPVDQVKALLVDRSGGMWVGGRGGLLRRRSEGAPFEPVPGAAGLALVTRLFEDSKGRIWAGTAAQGAAVLDAASGAGLRSLPHRPERPEGLSHFWVYGFAESEGRVWVATFGAGVDLVDLEGLTVTARLRHDPALDDTPGGDRIGALLKDRAGLVWLGTWGQGLAFHDPEAQAFRAFRRSPGRPDGLSHPAVVRALERADGTIWAGTNGNGIDILDREGRLRGSFRPSPKDPGALSDGAITCLAEGADGTAWVATLDGTLHRLPPGARRFQRYGTAQGLPGGPIRALAFGSDGDLWAGSSEGLARLPARGGPVTTYRHREEDGASLSGNAVEALAFTAGGTLWVGTSQGLNAFDPSTGRAVRILKGERSLPDNWVPDLAVARDGRLWVATQAGACVMTAWDGTRAAFEAAAPRLGRPAGPVESVVEDAEGCLWLGPRLRLDPRTWTAQDFGPADGCAFRTFFIASRARCRDGRLLFGSPEGLLVADPRRLRPWTYAPPVVAAAVRVDGLPVPLPQAGPALVVPAGAKGFSVEVAALDFTAPALNRYRHRLEGFDGDWTDDDAAHRTLAYTRLRPGDYTLVVEGSNRAGRWNGTALRLPVKVLPAFYETWAFRLAAALALAALAAAAYRLRVRALEARGRALEATVAERTRDLASANAELALAQEKISRLMASSPDLLEDLEGWVARMAQELAEFSGGCGIAALALTEGGLVAYGAHPRDLPSFSTLASLEAPEATEDGRLLLPARGPSGEVLGVVVVEGPSLIGNAPLQRLCEGFAHQFGAALDMIRVRTRLHAAEAKQAKTLEEFHAKGIATLQVCVRCGLCVDHTVLRCPEDGGRLEVPRALPYRFLGRYRFLRSLGAGGMGAVYEAEDEQLGRRVAVKLIRPELVNETATRLRFEREAHAIAKVGHPGVVVLHDSGSTGDGQLYLIMERLQGMDVASALRRFGRAHPRQAALFLRQGAEALAAAHAAGLVHRDLKPQNLFLVPAQAGFLVKLLDFGLAKDEETGASLTRTGLLLGTPAYMAPEQLRGGEADTRSDLYAFAAVAYEVLTRKPVVAPEATRELLRGRRPPPPTSPSGLVPGLPSRVDALFAQALAEDPSLRPASILAWAEEAAALLESVQAPGGWPEVIPFQAQDPWAAWDPSLPGTRVSATGAAERPSESGRDEGPPADPFPPG